MNAIAESSRAVVLNGVTVDIVERGNGAPIVFLHAENGLAADGQWASALAASGRLIAPTHPGFGASELPRWMSTVDDIAYAYLDLFEVLALDDVLLVGVGIGGWIAAEIAIKNATRLRGLVLANAVGIKVGDRETRDIVDIFATTQSDLLRLAYEDPALGAVDPATMSEEEALAHFRGREALALFTWSPYMHNPKLYRRLNRIHVPSLILWGASDGITPVEYGRAYAAAIPNASFETIAHAGHYPHVEQPAVFAERVTEFGARCEHMRQIP